MDLTSVVFGFIFGVVVTAVAMFLVFSGRVKSLSIGKEGFKIEGKQGTDLGNEDSHKNIEVPVTGVWLRKADRPGSRFGRVQDCGMGTPRTVVIKQGEVYRFTADPGFTDDDLRKLSTLAHEQRLRYLGFHNCRNLSVTGLAALAKFVHLWDIDLSNTNANDSLLESLTALKALKQVDLRDCNVTRDGLSKFQAALPNCKVVIEG